MTLTDVDAWFDALDHPMKAGAQQLRRVLASLSPEVQESVKWKAPNFALKDDFATMNLRRAAVVQVIFHTGAKPKPGHPEIMIEDPSGLLRRADRNRFVVTFSDEPALLAALPAFTAIATAWVGQLQ